MDVTCQMWRQHRLKAMMHRHLVPLLMLQAERKSRSCLMLGMCKKLVDPCTAFMSRAEGCPKTLTNAKVDAQG